MKPRLFVASAVIVAAVATFILARPSGDGGLSSLRADPLATWRPGLLAGWNELGQSARAAEGARPASVRSGFVVGRNGDGFYDEALDAAKDAGWTVHDIAPAALSPPVQRTATARKAGPDGREFRGVVVLTQTPGDENRTEELTIELTALTAGG